ncbi:MAG TPA: inorganic phosphate transporter [Thermoanaerobaculia bacterium]
MITLLIICTLIVAFANGANDISKGIATLVGSGVSNYRAATIWGTIWTFLGVLTAAFVTQALVATFSGKGLVQTPDDAPAFLLAVALGAIGWLIIATRTGMPVSTTHSLVGALTGTALVDAATHGVMWTAVLKKVGYPLLFSPFVSLLLVVLLLPLLSPLLRKSQAYCVCIEAAAPAMATPCGAILRDSSAALPVVEVAPMKDCGESVVRFTLVDSLHWLSAGATSFFRGLNDAPKILALGVAAALATGISSKVFYVMLAVAMGAGALLAGKRVTETLAQKVVRLEPANGFAANFVTSILVCLASRFALPVSTTHVSSGAIIGIGMSKGKGVRWRMVAEMALAWVVTLPCSALIAAIVYKVVS